MPDPQEAEVRRERAVEDVVVARVEDVPLGGLAHVVADGRDFVILNREGRLHAYRDECPHQGAPMHCGIITGAMVPTGVGEDYEYAMEGEFIACPRHRWKFSVESGEAIFGVDPRRLSAVDVRVEDGQVIRRTPAG
jgi:nitrite reductase/ring-hydroxylating ferredoxin subunit